MLPRWFVNSLLGTLLRWQVGKDPKTLAKKAAQKEKVRVDLALGTGWPGTDNWFVANGGLIGRLTFAAPDGQAQGEDQADEEGFEGQRGGQGPPYHRCAL